jgi:hypothetical protein
MLNAANCLDYNKQTHHSEKRMAVIVIRVSGLADH